MSKNKFCVFWMTYKGCDRVVANTEWMRRSADPFNNPQSKGEDGEVEIAVRKYRYIDAATEKSQESVVEAGYKDIKKPTADDVNALVANAQTRGIGLADSYFQSSLPAASMATSLDASFGTGGGANDEDFDVMAKQAAQGTLGLKELLGALDDHKVEPSPVKRKQDSESNTHPKPIAEEPYDVAWELGSVHDTMKKKVAALKVEVEKAGNISVASCLPIKHVVVFIIDRLWCKTMLIELSSGALGRQPNSQ